MLMAPFFLPVVNPPLSEPLLPLVDPLLLVGPLLLVDSLLELPMPELPLELEPLVDLEPLGKAPPAVAEPPEPPRPLAVLPLPLPAWELPPPLTGNPAASHFEPNSVGDD
jgi:hypothetical protein